jgi:hypothetical protein
MEKKPPPFSVLLDANVWIEERLLRSSLGGALLYAIVGAKATLALPEIVEREVDRVLPELARRAVQSIRRDMTLLNQLSGRQMTVSVPSSKAVGDGVAARWKQLSGSMERIPFTFEQAKTALSRIIDKAPPCGENNEQFRDCCIWEAALSLADDRKVHLVTLDHAFYDGRKHVNGLAKALRGEVERHGVEVIIHPTVQELLTALGDTVVAIDEQAIGVAIVESVTPSARTIATERGPFELGRALAGRINATPKEALIAVSFDLYFELNRVGPAGVTGEDEKALLTLRGECDFDPNKNAVSGVEIKGWSQRIGHSWGSAMHFSSSEGNNGPEQVRIL